MRTDLFDFDLPDELIALRPALPRDAARLLVVRPPHRVAGQGFVSPPVLEDRLVRDLATLLAPGDALVVNDTKVIPAALQGTRERNGNVAHVSFNLIRRVDASRWRAFARPAKRLEVGDRITFAAEGRVCLAGSLSAVVSEKLEAGEVELSFSLHSAYLDEAIATLGDMPLPPYIALKRPPDEDDRASYQTMFAAHEGAVAAPTAALHFTPELMTRLEARGVERHAVTLHVGAGTFLPVKADDTDQHKMHSEWGEIRAGTAVALNAVRARGNRVVAVGTTALRLLESAADRYGQIHPFTGETDIFITPGYRFRAVDALMTNFHLPRSTLFMLVSAFAGLDTMHAAYRHAIRQRYRFYSYGDASLLFRAS
ncbi:MAG: tRNA preQ1(34) S-adenosylmethionine ribosyltransferase-isomerase QueA [Hyphomicrobiaceae bacterium]|nr:tRNA preQ1(34) S-adenosylmethionine ribosyltransferase-isomerase QueA [Hyphomicrobiaceae bacterium]